MSSTSHELGKPRGRAGAGGYPAQRTFLFRYYREAVSEAVELIGWARTRHQRVRELNARMLRDLLGGDDSWCRERMRMANIEDS